MSWQVHLRYRHVCRINMRGAKSVNRLRWNVLGRVRTGCVGKIDGCKRRTRDCLDASTCAGSVWVPKREMDVLVKKLPDVMIQRLLAYQCA